MRLVVDTNRIVAALLKDGVTREILLFSGIEFMTPEHAMGEIAKHKDSLVRKSGLGMEEIELILQVATEKVHIMGESDIRPHMKRAVEVMKEIDKSDSPFLACALASGADGIWSHDGHFLRQKLVKVYRNSDLIGLVRKC